MNYILLQTHEMISKIKNSQINIEKKGRAKSAIFSHENIKND